MRMSLKSLMDTLETGGAKCRQGVTGVDFALDADGGCDTVVEGAEDAEGKDRVFLLWVLRRCSLEAERYGFSSGLEAECVRPRRTKGVMTLLCRCCEGMAMASGKWS